MSNIYPNAPLIEAVFEIRFRAELYIESARHIFYNKIKDEFPKIFVPKITGPEPPALKPYRFTDENQTKTIQFSINRFSFHVGKEIYNQSGFQGFKEKCLNYMQLFCNCYKISDITRTGLRYINHIPFIRDKKGNIPVKSYLNLGDILPNLLTKRYNELNTSLLIPLGKGKLRMTVQSQKLQDPQEMEILILDFDYIIENGIKTDELSKYLANSHYHTKRIFMSMITPIYKKSI